MRAMYLELHGQTAARKILPRFWYKTWSILGYYLDRSKTYQRCEKKKT